MYLVYGPDDEIVQRGEIAYGEGTIEIGIGEDSDSYSLFITPEYSNADRFWNRACAVLQAAAIPICYLGALILCAVLFWRWRLRGPIVALDRASSRIAANDLGFTLEAQRSDELGRLTESFEAMRASLDANSREMWAQMEERRRLNAAFAARPAYAADRAQGSRGHACREPAQGRGDPRGGRRGDPRHAQPHSPGWKITWTPWPGCSAWRTRRSTATGWTR